MFKNIDVAKYLQENNIPVNVNKGSDIMEKPTVKASDILTGKVEDKQVNNMSEIFPRSGAGENGTLY